MSDLRHLIQVHIGQINEIGLAAQYCTIRIEEIKKIHWHGNQSRCYRVILQQFTQSYHIGKCCQFSWWNVAAWIS